MNISDADPAQDFITMTAVLALGGEDSLAIIGAWNSMETLARKDPDGCVRLSGLAMSNSELAAFFHSTEAIVEKTVILFEKLKRLTVTDGLIKVLGCAGETGAAPREGAGGNAVSAKPALPATALAIKREKDRIRKAKSRVRQKQAQTAETGANATPVTTCDKRDMCDSKCDRRDTIPANRGDSAIPAGCDQRDAACNSNNIYPLDPSHAHKPVSKYVDLNQLIPLHELPEECRNVITEWNRLPLPKFRGLVPELLEKLKYLMQRYGETTLCKTVSGIAGNDFLLGKKEGRTWTVSLGWLLEPENFAKVLSGKYRDRQYGDSHCLHRHTGERLPFYLPGEGEEGFTPEERQQALSDLFIPTTPAQLKAARLVGLPGYKEATA